MIPGELISLIARRRLVAEVRTDTAMQALSVVDALAAGGVGVFEIALTIPGASEILTHYATRSDIIVGVGAALEARQALDALSSGARFVASPIFSPEIAQLCQEKGAACVLGALTPTEIINAQRAGAEMVKLFPVEAIGGPAYVRSLLRQLTHISVQVSGGFAVEHLVEYFQLPVRSIALGALLAPPTLVDRGSVAGHHQPRGSVRAVRQQSACVRCAVPRDDGRDAAGPAPARPRGGESADCTGPAERLATEPASRRCARADSPARRLAGACRSRRAQQRQLPSLGFTARAAGRRRRLATLSRVAQHPRYNPSGCA